MGDGARLTIILRPNGDIELEGPVHNKFLCYAMLECARDAISHANNKGAVLDGGKIEKPSESDVRTINSVRR